MTTSQNVYIDNLSYSLGDEVHSVESAVALGRTLTGAEAFTDAGFRQHWVAGVNTTAYDLAKQSVTQIADRLQDTGTIIYSTCLTLNGNLGRQTDFESTRDVKHHLEYPGSHLQADFELKQANVVGLNQQACTSVLGSMRVAHALLNTEEELQQILCVSADRFPENALYEQAYNLISDGACAFTVSRKESGFRLLSTAALTNGAMCRASDDESVGHYFSYTNQVIVDCLKKAKISPKEIQWVVPQNTNRKAWIILSRIFGLPMERIFLESLPEVAHIISSDNIVNLKKLTDTGKLQSGDKILLTMAGYGLNWQAVLLERV